MVQLAQLAACSRAEHGRESSLAQSVRCTQGWEHAWCHCNATGTATEPKQAQAAGCSIPAGLQSQTSLGAAVGLQKAVGGARQACRAAEAVEDRQRSAPPHRTAPCPASASPRSPSARACRSARLPIKRARQLLMRRACTRQSIWQPYLQAEPLLRRCTLRADGRTATAWAEAALSLPACECVSCT